MIERLFYPLAELAERWGCSMADLLHLGIQDRAQICANIYGLATSIELNRLEADTPGPSPGNRPLADEKQRDAEAHDANFLPWRGRMEMDMPPGLFQVWQDDLRFFDMPGVDSHNLHDALKFDYGGWWECKFNPPVTIKLEHLCIGHDEAQRLSTEEFGGSLGPDQMQNAATLMRADQDPDPQDLPFELQVANIAFRAVSNGYGDQSATFKNRLTAYLQEQYKDLGTEAINRVATVANPDKSRGRKNRSAE